MYLSYIQLYVYNISYLYINSKPFHHLRSDMHVRQTPRADSRATWPCREDSRGMSTHPWHPWE